MDLQHFWIAHITMSFHVSKTRLALLHAGRHVVSPEQRNWTQVGSRENSEKSVLDLQVNAHGNYWSYLISLLELVLSVDFLSTIVDSLASCCWSSITSWLFCRTRSLFISSSRLCDSGISPVMSYINIIINIIVMSLFIYSLMKS